MKSTTFKRSSLAVLALALSHGMAACGSDDSSTALLELGPQGRVDPDRGAPPTESGEFGAGCAAVPKTGDGSFQGMATAPVATAASTNPVLSTLVTAVGAAEPGRHPELRAGAHRLRPGQRRLRRHPQKDLNALLADKPALTKVLTHHVIAGKIAPEDLAGTHKTLAGDEVTVKGSGENFTVGDADANVICGNVQTANATVYVIDGVLMPEM